MTYSSGQIVGPSAGDFLKSMDPIIQIGSTNYIFTSTTEKLTRNHLNLYKPGNSLMWEFVL